MTHPSEPPGQNGDAAGKPGSINMALIFDASKFEYLQLVLVTLHKAPGEPIPMPANPEEVSTPMGLCRALERIHASAAEKLAYCQQMPVDAQPHDLHFLTFLVPHILNSANYWRAQ